MTDWQDISTAPRDGTWLLLFCPSGLEERDYDVRNAPLICVGNYSPADWQSARWLSVETYTEVHDYGGMTGVSEATYRLEIAPTHWLPLPPAPTVLESE